MNSFFSRIGSGLARYLSQARHVDGTAAPTDARLLRACLRPGDVVLVEADIVDGVRAVGCDAFDGLHCRVCRAVGLSDEETAQVADYAIARIGHQYDLRNVLDLVRYLVPTPPVPVRWRRRMLSLGSGDPTRAICSTLIAQAFQSVRYPVLPVVEMLASNDPTCPGCFDEILHVRHHSLFVPRDFDVSPYFDVIKPTLAAGFDHRRLTWGEGPGPG